MDSNITPPTKRRAVFDTPNRLIKHEDQPTIASESSEEEEPLSSQMSSLSIATQDEEPTSPTKIQDPCTFTLSASDSLSMYFTNDKPLGEEELLVYTLLLENYGEKAFKKSFHVSKYETLVDAVKVVFEFKCSSGALKNYVVRVKNNEVKGIGRIKRRLRWIYFRKQIDDCLALMKPYMAGLFKNQGKDAEIGKIKTILSQVCNNEETKVEIIESELVESFNTSIKPKLKKNWSINSSYGMTRFYRFGSSIGYAELEVVYSSRDNTLEIVVEGRPKNDRGFIVTTYDELQSKLIEYDQLLVCPGVRSESIEDLEELSVLYHTKDKKVGAYVQLVQSRFREKVIRSSFCHSLLPENTESTCEQCLAAARYYERKVSLSETITTREKQGRLDQLTYDELLTRAREQQKDIRNTKKRNSYLQEKIREMVQVGSDTDTELRTMFKLLTKGILTSDAKVKENTCEWEECGSAHKNPEELYSHACTHIKTHHVAPADKSYACMWEGCSKTFKKVHLLKKHLIDHTGSTSDTFFKILLADQAKALTTPSRQMRWHPLVIKWCLRTYSKSHTIYEDMRQGGFLKLPTGRTLSDYKNFDAPSSGWHYKNMEALKARFIKLQLPKKASIGGLFFDELKIKEGLVWSQSTWELVGYVDIDEGGRKVGSKDMLATHILQFFYRSLFDSFVYPCAFFLTKGIKKETLNRVFWEGISMLEMVNIHILLVCCDGASENRAFINFNRDTKDDFSCRNPFTNMPIFFLSDPPHLIKKLRNNLFKSGKKEDDARYTRLMTLNGQHLLWQHIVDVYDRDKLQYLQETPLRRAHIDLDSLSKMRVKLAVEVVASPLVRANMAHHDQHNTEATQQYLEVCEQFWYIFNSETPLRSSNDHRIQVLIEIEVFLEQWVQQLSDMFHSKSERRDHFMSWQTLEDLKLTLGTMKSLIEYIESDHAFMNEFGHNLYIIPKRINQDFVESFFSKQRQSCGGTQNMTAFTYGYNIYSSLSQDATRLVRYKQTNVVEVEECYKAVIDKQTLPKRRSSGVAPNEIDWPLDL